MADARSKTFVLVHGGSHGAWCWVRVTDRLRAAGHRVSTPTLTGLGERHHLTSPLVDLNTQIQDVVAHIECEELDDVIVVAHSFGGMPVCGAVDRIPSRIRHVVFLDALIGRNGKAAIDRVPTEALNLRARKTIDVNGTPSFVPYPPEFYGEFTPEDRAWLARRLTPQPVKTHTTPLTLAREVGAGRPCTYIRCTKPRLAAVEESYAYARDLGMTMRELATSHNAMVTAPDELVKMLMEIG